MLIISEMLLRGLGTMADAIVEGNNILADVEFLSSGLVYIFGTYAQCCSDSPVLFYYLIGR